MTEDDGGGSPRHRPVGAPAPRAEVVYHLGAHKTASSLLQRFLRDTPELLARHRIVYLSRSDMNHCVGWGRKLLRRPDVLEGRIAGLLGDERWDTLITSHENTLGPPIKDGGAHLYPRGPEIVAQLAGVLRRWPARAVLYIRPQDEFVESYYLQRIQQGGHLPFPDWLAQVDLRALSWRPVVDALVEHFGPELVEVVDFGLIRRGPEAFIADFFRRVDPALGITADRQPPRNPSLSGTGLRIALALNRHLRTDWQRKTARSLLQRHFSNRSQPRPVLLSAAGRAQLRQRYAREYAQLTGAGPADSPSRR